MQPGRGSHVPCDHRGRRGRRAWRVFRLHVTSRQRCRSRSQRRRRNRWQRYLCQPQWAAGKPFNPLGAMGGGGASKAAAKDGGEAAAKDGVQDKEKGQDDEEANLSILSEENEAVRRTTPSEPPPVEARAGGVVRRGNLGPAGQVWVRERCNCCTRVGDGRRDVPACPARPGHAECTAAKRPGPEQTPNRASDEGIGRRGRLAGLPPRRDPEEPP